MSIKERLSADYTWEVESPFLDEELFVGESEENWELRAAALAPESPFLQLNPEAFEEEAIGKDERTLVTEQREFEEPEFEFDLASSRRDFSLKGIADSDNLPDEIRTDILRDGKTDVNDLASRALWIRHADMSGKPLERTGSKHAKLRAEWRLYAQQARVLIWLKQVVEELDKTRGDLPRDFLLGWMAVESDGSVGVVTDRPERGYFQIDWKAGEAREQLGLSATQFKKLSTDRVFSLQKGIELAEKYRQWILKNYPSVPDKSELLWRLTKGHHAASGSLKGVLDRLVSQNTSITWAAVSPLMPGFMRRNVDATLAYAGKLKPFADLVGAATPAPAPGRTQPELYGESAPWLRKDEDDEFTEQEHRPPPKKVKVSDTFAIPFRWVCKIAVRKNGKYHHGGSGVLISDRQVLTAAHVVYDVFKDRAQYDLEVTPAQNGNDDLGTYAASGQPLILSDYEPAKTDYDYALITLNTSIGSKKFQKLNNDKLCFWGSPDCGAGTVLVRVDPKDLITQTAYTAGYPRNKGGSQMWCFSGLLVSVVEKNRTMSFTGEATEGQSGSPVWMQKDGQFILVGVLVARGGVNIVVRVTREFVRQIQDWMGGQRKEAPEYEFDEDRGREEWEYEWEPEAEVEDQPVSAIAYETMPEDAEAEESLEEFQTGAPAGLALLDHMHVPKAPDPAHPGTFKTGLLTVMKTADMNPGWIDANDNLVTDKSGAGLQRCLELSITSDFQGLLSRRGQTAPAASDRIHVALVDLTGNKLTKPDFAGWGSTLAIFGASVPKILPLYAAYQLRSDLRDLISRRSPKDGPELEKFAIDEWKAKGLTTKLPDLVFLFDVRKWKPSDALDFTAATRDTFANISKNCPPGKLIAKVGFPYIGSVAWQSGLFHPTRGGLWLKVAFCRQGSWASPVKSPHGLNASALSAATYFTLLAQGRLVDDPSSGEIKDALKRGCVTSLLPPLPVVASKCGFASGHVHDCAWIEDADVRYVIAVMSRLSTNAHARLYTKLCKELDKLIRENNNPSRKLCI